MQPGIYSAVMSALGSSSSQHSREGLINTIDESVSELSSNQGSSLESLLNDQAPKDHIMFVVKNYEAGLSRLIHNDIDNKGFEVCGPLGESLGVHTSGSHLVFAAGTGVLPFLDLVAHVVYCALGIAGKIGVNENDVIGRDFKLKFYVSFRSKQEAVALEFLEAVQAYFKRVGNPCFELIVRLSNQKGGHWDKSFIDAQVRETGEKNIKKIWVCGPPAMTEKFDRAFYDFKAATPERFAPGVVHFL
jgi:NAD(P)H-flavin reductase